MLISVIPFFSISGGHAPGSFESVISGSRFPQTVQHDIDLLGHICGVTKPGGLVKIVQAVSETADGLVSPSKLMSGLKLAGFVKVQSPKIIQLENKEQEDEIRHSLNLKSNDLFQIVEIQCFTPNFQAGSSTPLSFAQKINKPKEKKVWSLKEMDDDDVDLIDEDDLLDEVIIYLM